MRGGHKVAVIGAARALSFMREPSNKANKEKNCYPPTSIFRATIFYVD
jgi:hypothetical protein